MRTSATSPSPRRDARARASIATSSSAPSPARRRAARSTPRMAGHVVEDAAPPERRDLGRVAASAGRSRRGRVRAEPPCQRSSSPTVMCACASMCAPRVLAAQHELAHVAEAGVVRRPPRLVAGRADALRRAVGEDLERRVAGEQRHASGSARARAGTCARSRTRPVAASTRSGLGAAAVAAGVPWVDDAAVGAELGERALDHRRGERAGARLVRRDPVERVAQLGGRAVARSRASTQPSTSGTIVSRKRERVGGLERCRPPASRRPRARGRARRPRAPASVGRRPARAATRRRCRRSGPGASGCTRASPSRARSPTSRPGRGRRARCRA